MDFTEIKINIDTKDVDTACAIAHMTVPYGIYIEDYSDLEQGVLEIANINLIDEELTAKNRETAIIHIYIDIKENQNEAVSFLNERLKACDIEYTIDKGTVKEEDWENGWKQYFKPTEIGEKILILPSWEKEPLTERKILKIDPGASFGTGTHATTKICMETLEKYIKGGETVLDIGTGSGILSIASLLLGAKTVTGVDIDGTAVRVAIENGSKNGYTAPQYNIIKRNLTTEIVEKFDICIANIVADVIFVLIENIKEYMNDNGIFIMSGIIENREDEVTTALSENGLTIIDRKESEGWVCLAAIDN